MKFFESGGRVYGIFETSWDLIPESGYHIPGKMAGVWFGPIRLIGDLSVDMGDFKGLKRKIWGKVLEFENGKLQLMAAWKKRCFFIKALGKGRLTIIFDGTPSWLSEKLGWKGDLKIEGNEVITDDGIYLVEVSNGTYEFREKTLEVLFDRETGVKIWQGTCLDFWKEKENKEGFLKRHGADKDWMKRFLVEMYFDSGYGKGLMAGLEEFPWWFNVDLFFTAPVLISKGLGWIVKDTLLTLLEKMEFLPPHEVVSNGVVNEVFNEFEVFTAISTVSMYTEGENDDSFIPHLKHLMEIAEKLILKGLAGRGMVEVEGYEGKVLDLETFAYKALRDLEMLERKIGIEMGKVLKWKLEKFEKEFLKEWYVPARGLFKGPVHFTQVLPLYFGLVPRNVGRAVLRNIERIGMITKYGLKHSLQMNEKKGLYGEKAEKVWWLTNALLKRANQMYGNVLNLSYLEELFERDLKSIGYPPEIVGGESGCFAQSWSVLFPDVISSMKNMI